MHQLEHIKLNDIVDTVKICFDPNDSNTLVESDVKPDSISRVRKNV